MHIYEDFLEEKKKSIINETENHTDSEDEAKGE